MSQKTLPKVDLYLRNDSLLLNAFAINRLQNLTRDSQTYACVGKDGQVDGYLSVMGSAQITDIWVRGQSSREVDELLDFFSTRTWSAARSNKLFANSDPRFVSAIKKRLLHSRVHLQNVMIIRKGEEKLASPSVPVFRLGPEHAFEYAKFVAPEGLEITQDVLDENQRFLRDYFALAIYNEKENRLISTANAIVMLPEVWVISSVMTDNQYHRMGYGTNVVSALTGEALNHSDAAMLYVDRDNRNAIRIYEKLGFHKVTESICVEANREGTNNSLPESSLRRDESAH